MTAPTRDNPSAELDPVERRIVLATQGGLPIVAEPWRVMAADVGIPVDEFFQRLRAMLARGVIRRIGAVPNHYAIGYTANGMSVWDITDEHVDAVGEFVGTVERVTHCYRCPRHLQDWSYNRFAMVHGQDRDEVRAQIDAIADAVSQRFGDACRARDVLFPARS